MSEEQQPFESDQPHPPEAIEDFREKWNAIAEVNNELVRKLETECNMRQEAVLEAVKERNVSDALEARLGEVASRKLALAVAHGDVAPELYEGRRRAEIEGVRNLVAALRVIPATRPKNG